MCCQCRFRFWSLPVSSRKLIILPICRLLHFDGANTPLCAAAAVCCIAPDCCRRGDVEGVSRAATSRYLFLWREVNNIVTTSRGHHSEPEHHRIFSNFLRSHFRIRIHSSACISLRSRPGSPECYA